MVAPMQDAGSRHVPSDPDFVLHTCGSTVNAELELDPD